MQKCKMKRISIIDLKIKEFFYYYYLKLNIIEIYFILEKKYFDL